MISTTVADFKAGSGARYCHVITSHLLLLLLLIFLLLLLLLLTVEQQPLRRLLWLS